MKHFLKNARDALTAEPTAEPHPLTQSAIRGIVKDQPQSIFSFVYVESGPDEGLWAFANTKKNPGYPTLWGLLKYVTYLAEDEQHTTDIPFLKDTWHNGHGLRGDDDYLIFPLETSVSFVPVRRDRLYTDPNGELNIALVGNDRKIWELHKLPRNAKGIAAMVSKSSTSSDAPTYRARLNDEMSLAAHR